MKEFRSGRERSDRGVRILMHGNGSGRSILVALTGNLAKLASPDGEVRAPPSRILRCPFQHPASECAAGDVLFCSCAGADGPEESRGRIRFVGVAGGMS